MTTIQNDEFPTAAGWQPAAARSCSIELVRDGWRGMASLAWTPARLYAELAACADQFLGPRERDAFGAFAYERRRISYLLGRHAAKMALAHLAHRVPAHAIDIVPGCFNQPVVHAQLDVPLGVSISHTASSACAAAFPETHPIGIDVEDIDAARAGVMKTRCTARELDAIADAGDDVTLAAVVWTAKEAVSKVLRCGMTVPFELLEVEGMSRHGADAFGVFRNFPQYRFQSCVRGSAVVSLVVPRKTALVLAPDVFA